MKNYLWPVVLICLLLSGCKENKKYHDLIQKDILSEKSDVLKEILRFQEDLNSEFKNPEISPLRDKDKKNFEGLNFFKPDSTLVIEAKFIRTPNAKPFLMATTTGRQSKEVVYGIIQFSIAGSPYELELYQNEDLKQEEGYEDYLFLPFKDLTNGEETYGGGRYIDLRIPESDVITVDFNKAYNPYCAYNPKYSCPIVPSVNTLRTKILAGVKAFEN